MGGAMDVLLQRLAGQLVAARNIQLFNNIENRSWVTDSAVFESLLRVITIKQPVV